MISNQNLYQSDIMWYQMLLFECYYPSLARLLQGWEDSRRGRSRQRLARGPVQWLQGGPVAAPAGADDWLWATLVTVQAGTIARYRKDADAVGEGTATVTPSLGRKRRHREGVDAVGEGMATAALAFCLGGDGDGDAGVGEGTPEQGGRSLRRGGDGNSDASAGEGTGRTQTPLGRGQRR